MFTHLPLDERWNVYTHALGALLALIGISFLFTTTHQSTPLAKTGLLTYGFSLVFLFSVSAIYHAVLPQHRPLWQKIDHIGIFILIAGTYTPVSLTVLRESSGVYLFFAIWTIALLGGIYKLFFIGRFQNFSLFLYLAMGWLAIFDIDNILHLFPQKAFYYLLLGGFFYSVGTVFYRWERFYFHHVIWHLFVLAGAASHFQMVWVLYA